MESKTYLKDIKLSPKKLRMYLDVIKKMSPQEALDYLMYAPHKQGQIYYKAIHSAINNATQTLKVSPNMLQFKLFTIEEGHAIKRYNAGARGMVKPFKRRYSHIKIILEEKKGTAPEAASTKVEKKEVTEKTESAKQIKKVEKTPAKAGKKEVKKVNK